MEIDIRTLALIYLIANVMNNGLIFMIWRMYRRYYRGLAFLFADMSMQTVSSLFLLLRGQIPDVVSIVATNLFSVLGLLFVLKGLERFFGREKIRAYNYVIFCIFMSLVFYFSMVNNNLFVRNLCLSAMIIVFNGQSALFLFRGLSPYYRKTARLTAGVLLAFCVFSAARILGLILIPQSINEFFSSGIVNSIAMIGFILLNILITAGIILMVSHRLLLEVQTEKDKYNRAFQSSPYALLLTKIADGKIFEVNEGFEKTTGYRPAEVIGKTTLELGMWLEIADREAFVSALMSEQGVRDVEMKFRIKNGEIMTGLVSAKRISAFGEDCILTSISDVTDLIRIKERLEKMALHDTLTGLPNRQLFYDRAGIAIAGARREKLKIAVITLDVDGLKFINDHFGHTAGDHVLVTIANRLEGLLRKGDTVSRFGGDEFLILLNGVNHPEDAQVTARRIMECASEPMEIAGECIAVTASLGIAIYPTDDTDIESLIRKSDEAMYYIKTHGRNGLRFYGENV
ncbi:MAG TPA: sensor domain-containing diguanylate cyclase [Clostridia bacterium]|nr:sensor domain-containing diguanylate cyclase [Clostridia bacterium]